MSAPLLKTLAREPLVHFLVLGAAIFLAYGLVSKRVGFEPGKIVVTQGQLASLMEHFTRVRQRPPTSEEWAGLIEDRVREEVYCREAIALGLDRDDTVIRRRLRQKMEFVSDDVAAQATPTDAELEAYLQTHSEAFRVEPQFTFRHVYLDPGKRGANLTRDAADMLATLNQAGGHADLAAVGDAFLLDHDFAAVPAREVTRQFGAEFTAKLSSLRRGRWEGPIQSAFGSHLVFEGERTEARLPALAEVRDVVRREWESSHRQEANEAFYQKLLEQYTVTIEPPPADPEARIAAKQ
jgi:hypothetical protein